MKKILIVIFSFFFSAVLLAQEKLENILHSFEKYDAIVTKAEQYFQAKHPNKNLKQLAGGTDRDGEYVKFMRWQSFWKHSLNADGTIGDISAHYKNPAAATAIAEQMSSPYNNVSWTNLSYNNYITSQIGLGRTTSMGFHPTDPNTFYVGAAIGGIWKTTDGGVTYTPKGDELPFMAVSSIIVNKNTPDHIYIAVSDHVWYGPSGIGVYKSRDGGNNWTSTALSFDLAENIRIYWMEADPNNSNKMFVATSNGLYRTDDAFLSITKVNNSNTFDVKVNKGNSNIVYQCGNSGEFLRSTDGGSTFTLIRDFGNDNVYAAITSLNTAKVYARSGNILYKSTNSGASFSATTSTLPENFSVLAFSQTNQNTLLTGNFETQRSDNDGTSFYATSQWLGSGGLTLIHVDQRNIFHNPLQTDFIYYCNDGGLYRYVISTNQFVNLCNGLKITQFYDIAVSQSDSNIIGGGSQDNGNVFRDANGIWNEYAPTGDGMNQEIDPTDANTRYWAYQLGSLRRWVNGTNTSISPPGQDGNGAWETPYRLDPTNPSRIIAGYDRVYQSLNKGTSWTDITGTAVFGGDLEEIAIAKSNPNRIYAVRTKQLFVKDIASNTWTTRTLPEAITDIEVDPLNMNLIYVSIPGFLGGKKVFKSSDAGVSWENISGTLPNISVGAIELYETIPGAMFIGTDAGVFYRDNTLIDWQQYGQLPHTRVTDIEIQYASKLIRVGTHGRGVLEAPIIIAPCALGAPDADNDGVCDANDVCPNFNNALNGTPCNDGDPNTTGEKYTNCECSGGVATLTYCAATGAAGTGGDWIKMVTLNNLQHSSLQIPYSNFKDKSATLAPGGTYKLKVYMNQTYPLDKVYAWIDYDRDGVYEPTELVNMTLPNGENISDGNVNVPANVGTIATTMRVRSIYGDPNIADPCGSYFGEVEDYTINFTECAAAGAANTGDNFISKVKLNSIDNNSAQSFYSDFKHIATDLAKGQSYPIEITLKYAFSIDDVYAWIDYNHNNVFEISEQVTLSKPAVGSNSVSTGVVTVPASALSGKTTIRICAQNDDPNAPQPCGSAYAGEVEDYTVNLTYCAAAGAVGTSDDYINRVKVNTIENLSGKTTYSNLKNIFSTDLIRGAAYPVEVGVAYAFAIDSVFVWIDYDKDGLFESSEQTIMSKLPVQFNSISQGIINVPTTAIQGQTVMRVRVVYSSPNIANPCGDLFGEVEDYTVNLTYCGAVGAGGTSGDWIQNVKVNNIDHSSVQTGYSNFKNVSTPVYRNNAYQLRVNINYAFNLDTVYAWIDYDKNGSFTTNERIMMSGLTANIGNSASTGTITVPSNVPLGETTLRVRVIYANPNPADPCNAYFGEVEDYSLVITDNQGIGPCIPGITLGKELVSLSSGTYKAGETIIATSTIINGKIVRMPAGKSIIWNPGFIAENGAIVRAEIVGCLQ